MKSDALFSYQPPFNILAFLILKPASWFLSPRALHSVNVFLIKVTSLPQLVVISLYERHLTSGSKLRETGKDAAQTLFNSLPRHIKNMPLVEALMGSSSNDLFDAIFDVEVGQDDYELFDESDGEGLGGALRSMNSRENVRVGQGGRAASRSPVPQIRKRRPTSLGRLNTERREASSARGSPRTRGLALTSMGSSEFLNSPEVMTSPTTTSNRSPLARLFGSRFSSAAAGGSGALFPLPTSDSTAAQVAVQAATNTEASVKHIESLLEAVSELPVQRLKEEMKELQVSFLLLSQLISPFKSIVLPGSTGSYRKPSTYAHAWDAK